MSPFSEISESVLLLCKCAKKGVQQTVRWREWQKRYTKLAMCSALNDSLEKEREREKEDEERKKSD